MTYETLLYEVRDNVACLTLNRPERLNALSLKLLEELGQALERASAEKSVRCVLLAGAGRGFCSGADLVEALQSGIDDPAEVLNTYYHRVVFAMRELSVPIVAAVQGPCAGAGMSLAIAADIIVAARGAYFTQAFTKIGLVPDAGSTYLLPRLIGLGRARAMMLLGEKIEAERARDWGLVWDVVEDGELAEAAFALAAGLATGPTTALSCLRRLLAASLDNELGPQLAMEAEMQTLAAATSDAAEGIQAFAQKRPPKFTGS